MAQEPLKQWNCKLPESLVEGMKARAEEEGTTATEVVIKAIRAYLDEPALPRNVDSSIYEARLQRLERQMDVLEGKSAA
jgi:polyhydroxyalkanoate synthesis regulator phasin